MGIICYGIDLGTTHTVVIRSEWSGGCWNNEPIKLQELRSFESEEEQFLLPSVVHFKENGDVIVGKAARDAVKTDPEHVYFNSKIGLGGDTDREHKAVECAAEILKVCFRAIYERDGERVQICVSVPAAFSQDKKKETEEAARRASEESGFFKGVKIHTTEEPYAAFLNIIICEKNFPANVIDKNTYAMLIDIGGGTLDIITCGFTFEENELHVNFRGKSPGDADEFAGASFDQKIKEKFMQDFLDHYHLQQDDIPDEVLCKLENQFQIYGEDAKKHLCSGTTIPYGYTPEFRVKGLSLPEEYGPFKLEMTKREMDKVLKPLIENIDGVESIDSCIQKHLSHNQMVFKDIDFIYLTGGMSKYDKIFEHIKDMTSRPVYRASNPLLCTAQGIAAAVHTMIDDDDFLTSFPLAKNTAVPAEEPEQEAEPAAAPAPAAEAIPVIIKGTPNQIGASFFIDVDGDLPVEIIPKTHPYPCPLTMSDVQLRTTSQSKINLIIFEGDNKYDPDLKLLKRKTILFADAIEKGTPVKISFKINENKIITFYGSINGAPPIEFDCYPED